MNTPGFAETSQAVLHENALNLRFPDDILSFPVMRRVNGRVLDAVFVYNGEQGIHAAAGRPYAWLLLDGLSGEVMAYTRCTVQDLAPHGLPSLSQTVTLSLADPLEERDYLLGCKRLYQVYAQLRPFAFLRERTPEQRALLQEYSLLLQSLAPVGHLPFYRALSPEFYEWLELMPPIELPQSVPHGLAEKKIQKQDSELPEPPPWLESLRAELLESVSGLSDQFEEKLLMDSAKERMLDQLHRELQEYKNDLLGSLTDALERDIIKLIEDIGRTVAAYRGKPPTRENYDRFFSHLEGVQTDLCDMLYRCGVEPFSVAGDAVDVQQQQILSTAPTADQSLDKTVASRQARGWSKNGKVLRPERITVYVYTPEDRGQQSLTI